MSELERAAAKMFCVGFDGVAVTPAIRRLIELGVSGVILFGRNVKSAEQVAKLCAELKSIAARPLIICIDQEGGRVRRLREGFTPIPSMRAVGQYGNLNIARQIGQILARELRAVNIDVNLAPVLDVDTNPANPVIADRSFGADPGLVTRLGCALIDGLQSEGVAACGKHFPGHGDTSQDSHLDLPRLPHSMERLARVELPPFAAAVRAGLAMIMTAHVIFEPLDAIYPATMSEPVLDGLLRRRLGFDGVVISDALEMKAIAAHFPVEEVVIRGVQAGIDLFAPCEETDLRDRAIAALVHAVERGSVSLARLDDSARRVNALASAYVKPPVKGGAARAVIGCGAHRAVLEPLLNRVNTADDADPTARLSSP
jgi:beta-N-acetylhexosaminidase